MPLSSHLTCLDVEECTASCVQLTCCTPGLKNLTVYGTTLSVSHDDGLLSCSGLTSLNVRYCSISGSNAGTEFTVGEDHMLCIPPNISSLSQLRRLLVAMETYNDDALDVSWTYGLTSLHSLDLHIEGEVTFSQDLTQLQQLTMLTVDATSWYGSIPDIPRMTRFEVNWKAMHNLQHIVLSGHMSFLDNVEEISLLKDLSLVSITEFEPRDCQTAVHLARLAYSLAAHKPQVQFTVKSCVVPVFSTPSSASD